MKIKKATEQKSPGSSNYVQHQPPNGMMTLRELHPFQPTLKELMALASDIAIEDRKLIQQREELFFAYRTLEVGYRRYWEFFNYAPDGYVVTDMNGLIKEVNQTILSMLAASRAELLDKPVTEVIPELHRGESGLQMDWLTGSQQIEATLYNKKRMAFHAAIRLAPHYDVHNEPVGLLWLIRDITESSESRNNLEFYAMQINRIQEEERKRIAVELHEEILQSLAAISLRADTILISEEITRQEIFEDLKKIREELTEVIEDIRRFSHELRPGVLDYLGLAAALETLASDLNNCGINTQLVVDGQERPATPDKEIALFRIAEEASKNIKSYSHADQASIHIQYTRNKIKLTVTDNGRGFESPERLSYLARQGKLGLIGIEEQARLHGGKFSIKTQPKRGTRVTVALPISDHSEKQPLSPG